MTILTLLQDILGDYHLQNDEYLFSCPFCHHQKKKLSVNIATNKWKCWVCNARGGHILWLLKKLNLSKKQLAQFRELFSDLDVKQFKETTSEGVIKLPSEFKPLWKVEKTYTYLHAINYLKKRNISSEDVIRYRMGYCDSGTYANRIIIPSYDSSNVLNYFTARSFYDSPLKYKNPPVSKNIICFENMIDFSEPLVLCEGMFDGIALRRNAIPLLGKTISKKLMVSILEHNVKDIAIFLDEDARQDALLLEKKLAQYNINVGTVFTTGKDASELGFSESWEQIDNASRTDFKDFIIQRING